MPTRVYHLGVTCCHRRNKEPKIFSDHIRLQHNVNKTLDQGGGSYCARTLATGWTFLSVIPTWKLFGYMSCAHVHKKIPTHAREEGTRDLEYRPKQELHVGRCCEYTNLIEESYLNAFYPYCKLHLSSQFTPHCAESFSVRKVTHTNT